MPPIEYLEFERNIALVTGQRFAKYFAIVELPREYAIVIDRRILCERGFGEKSLKKLADRLRSELRCCVWQTVG